MSEDLISKIRSKGYWRVLIRPDSFVETRVQNILDLHKILNNSAVNLRGWDYPHMDTREKPIIGDDWISQGIDWEDYVEYWRFYQSGQLLHLDGFKEDWMEQRKMFGRESKWPDSMRLGVVSALYTFTEIFELATRLSISQAGDESMHIDITLQGLSGRKLWLDDSKRWPFSRDYEASINEFNYQNEFSKGELASSSWSLALVPTTDLFRKFAWDPPQGLLETWQSELWGTRRPSEQQNIPEVSSEEPN